MELIYKDQPNWHEEETDDGILYWAGKLDGMDELVNILKADPLDTKTLENHLLSQKQCFGLMFQSKDITFAAVDRIASYPVFYSDRSEAVSNAAPSIAPLNTESLNAQAALEFAMAGYSATNKTLHQDISLLQAGEYILNGKAQRYYEYKPAPLNAHEEILLSTLAKAMDNAIARTIDYADGRTICVPLSGGLDSRIVLAKLKEHGYPNLTSFSYGIAENHEARKAEEVARLLDVPWQMVESYPTEAPALYASEERRSYAKGVHNYYAIPGYTEFEAFHALKTRKLIPEDSVIVNGQTGDFISGGHLKELFYEKESLTVDDVLDYIIDKHYGMWIPLQTPGNIEKIKTALFPYFENARTREDLMRVYESFEWQERQVKMVVHMQKCYEYFGYDWHLPLWDPEIMDFFAMVSFDQKRDQKLYKTYLKAYNYKGVFDTMSAKAEPWPKGKRWIPWAGRAKHLLMGRKAKESFYKKMRYYGDLHHQYAFFGKARYMRQYKAIRNFISMTIEDFFAEHNLPFPGDKK